MAFRVLAVAEADIDEAARHIAAHNPAAARRWLREVDRSLAILGAMPGLGAPRFHMMPNLRFLRVGRYLLLYLHVGDDAEVIRVVHEARRWERLLP